jgi:hypothetical protein
MTADVQAIHREIDAAAEQLKRRVSSIARDSPTFHGKAELSVSIQEGQPRIREATVRETAKVA